MSHPPDAEPPRGQARRRQILDAAAACFAREGFHGTSVARLSEEAGMSPGHIYHFFESKEAIINALVEERLERSLEMVRQFENAEDIFQAMIDRVAVGLSEKTDLVQAALELEILAEAARNPRVAASVRRADRVKRERLLEVIARASRARGTQREAGAAQVEIIMALFDGLAARAINHPELDRDALLPLLRRALETFI